MALYDSITVSFENDNDKKSFELELNQYNLKLSNSKKFSTQQVLSESIIFLSDHYEATLTALLSAYGVWKKYSAGKLKVTHPIHGEIELEGKIAEDYYKKHIANQSIKSRD